MDNAELARRKKEADQLVEKLRREIASKGYRENMGPDAYRKFHDKLPLTEDYQSCCEISNHLISRLYDEGIW